MDYTKAIMSARKNDDIKERNELLAKQKHEEDVMEKLKLLAPRMEKLMNIANQLLEAGYWEFLDPGEWGKTGFVSEGWAHHFGFMLDSWGFGKTRHISSMGIVAGGYCGNNDFHTTGTTTYMTDWHGNTPNGAPIKIEYAERTVDMFDDFERRFYSSLDIFLKNKGVKM